MSAGDHNKIIKETANEILSPHGILQKGQSRIWVDDNGWYLTVIEFQPSSRARGSYLNVSLFFLWNQRDHITFDFAVGSSRVSDPKGRQIFIEYEEDAQFKAGAAFLANLALEKALYYRKFRDPAFADKYFLRRQRRPQPTYFDVWNRMIYCLITGNQKAGKYFKILSQSEPPESCRENKELLNFFEEHYETNPDVVEEHLYSSILQQREFWRGKGVKQLAQMDGSLSIRKKSDTFRKP